MDCNEGRSISVTALIQFNTLENGGGGKNECQIAQFDCLQIWKIYKFDVQWECNTLDYE